MSWINPPPAVVAFRDALILTPTVQNLVLPSMTLLQRQARFHYPRADFRTDPMPGFILRRHTYKQRRTTAYGGLGSGVVSAMLHISDATIDDGTIESYCDAIVLDLASMSDSDSLYILEAEAGECVEPSPAMIAAAIVGQPDEASVTFRVCSITAEWEG